MKYRISLVIEVEGDEVEWLESAEKLEKEIKQFYGIDFPPVVMRLSKSVAETVKVEEME